MSQLTEQRLVARDIEHAALYAACNEGVALCTIVGIDGSFSRRLGSQLAVHADGNVTGDLADGCLEQQLASDAAAARGPVVKRYGRGSSQIDFRLPCGGGLDILIDPAPDRVACRDAAQNLGRRRPGKLTLAANDLLPTRTYIPAVRIQAFGEGPELEALQSIGKASGISIDALDKRILTLGQKANHGPADLWTAVVLLFHDHEWEAALLKQALESPAFYIGAQGGETARIARITRLLSEGVSEDQLPRLRGPIGNVAACRTPNALALSVLSEIVGEYEAMQPHH